MLFIGSRYKKTPKNCVFGNDQCLTKVVELFRIVFKKKVINNQDASRLLCPTYYICARCGKTPVSHKEIVALKLGMVEC